MRHSARPKPENISAWHRWFGKETGPITQPARCCMNLPKQCINAVANRQGQDPGPTSAKYYFLVSLAAGDALRASLTEDWNAVMDLHINADRLNLSEFQFEDSWQIAYSFIDQMLQIYAQGN